MQYKFTDENSGNVVEKEFDSMEVAKRYAREYEEYFDTQITVKELAPQTDGGSVSVPPTSKDPAEWLPDAFVDNVHGVQAINRKGYAVLARNNNISVVAEPVLRASETEFKTAEFRAIARTEDGCEYSGFGSAHVDRDTVGGGDDPYILNEMAETRAIKRALAYATGVGMVSEEELS